MENILFMLYEDYKDLTVEISILKTDNDMTLIQESDFMLYMQKKKEKDSHFTLPLQYGVCEFQGQVWSYSFRSM